MKRRVLTGLLCTLALAGCHHHTHEFRGRAVEPDVPAGAPLVGHWAPDSAQLGGKDLPVSGFGGATLNLTEGSYDFAGDKGTYQVLSTTPPARMDIHGVEGPNAGRLIPSIYELQGDQLTICYQLGPGVRPAQFGSPAGSQILQIHYHRTH